MKRITPKETPYPENLRAARLARKLSQERLAAELGVRQNYLSNIECGRRNPGPMFLRFLALYFSLPVEVVSGWFDIKAKAAA